MLQRKAAAVAEQLRQEKEAVIALAKEEGERRMQEHSEAAQDKLATVKKQADTLRSVSAQSNALSHGPRSCLVRSTRRQRSH